MHVILQTLPNNINGTDCVLLAEAIAQEARDNQSYDRVYTTKKNGNIHVIAVTNYPQWIVEERKI